MPAAEPAPPRTPARFDAAWLQARRWFRSKARPLVGVAVEEAVRLDERFSLLILRAELADGDAEHYLVPATADAGGALAEPPGGDGAWASLAAAVARGSVIEGARGRLRFTPMPALVHLLPGGAAEAAGLAERPVEGEQSNTSVRLGDRLILKLYRLLEPGAHPEVEMGAFLTEARFRWTPRLAGVATWEPRQGEPAAAAMVQELIPASGDGWAWMLSSLAAPPQGPLEALAGVAQIGGITAELHAALASQPTRPGFPARDATAEERVEWRLGAERQLAGALESVSGTDRERLEAVRGGILERFAAIETAEGASLSRIHGDYHLGQLLRIDEGFMVIDFEGEPARELAQRRQPASPLRDVAGMLRSLDYAVRTAERAGPDGFAHAEWLANARSALLGAYGGEASGDPALLTAFEAEKACYEVRYEANNRPDWAWLPIGALERLAA
jgi:trehalose synthase-fused probable maltokinase